MVVVALEDLADLKKGEEYEVVNDGHYFGEDYYAVKIDGRSILYRKSRFEVKDD